MNEIQRRRTFAIISHPDAGKTTLTEKFLLFGGQIQVAGAVKSNKIRKTATSDWMDIEKQRGISVSKSVMEFDYLPDGETGEPYKVNILDTPGHQDFAEDTYRTLTAVDSAIIVVDSAKGVEAQTRKLMEVCRMRNTPVIIFINKMDREGRDAFDLLDELEEELQIKVRPLSWPIGQGQRFKGVYNIYEQQLNLFTPNKQRVTEKVAVDIKTTELNEMVVKPIEGGAAALLDGGSAVASRCYRRKISGLSGTRRRTQRSACGRTDRTRRRYDYAFKRIRRKNRCGNSFKYEGRRADKRQVRKDRRRTGDTKRQYPDRADCKQSRCACDRRFRREC